MKYEKLSQLPKIFRTIEKDDGIIEYSCKNKKDHEILKELGYTILGNQDCEYYVQGLTGLNLSGDNTNGIFLYRYATKESINAFLNIVSNDKVTFNNYTYYDNDNKIVLEYKQKNTKSLF